jgi:tetratricopeptide (TPR) repeat protein
MPHSWSGTAGTPTRAGPFVRRSSGQKWRRSRWKLRRLRRKPEIPIWPWSAVRLDPWLAPARQVCGVLLLQSGSHLPDAEDSLVRCVELDPSLASGWRWLGLCYARQQRWDDALRAFDRSLSLSGDQPDVLFNRFLIHLRLGKRDAAESDLCRFAQLMPAGDLPARQLRGVLMDAAGLHCPPCVGFWLSNDTNPDHSAMISAYSTACSAGKRRAAE